MCKHPPESQLKHSDRNQECWVVKHISPGTTTRIATQAFPIATRNECWVVERRSQPHPKRLLPFETRPLPTKHQKVILNLWQIKSVASQFNHFQGLLFVTEYTSKVTSIPTVFFMLVGTEIRTFLSI
ncbi:7263_t:CDS:2 [Acaulospora morrowiae]|uniref:7263_t:CDS:1 n=1 Tax=Acaulospora morrowiae TaxID=94023 RepID=A0A9N8VRC9_9GLOM|nr:7263_t:CDS:2 [Acaulospora morrowiae]